MIAEFAKLRRRMQKLYRKLGIEYDSVKEIFEGSDVYSHRLWQTGERSGPQLPQGKLGNDDWRCRNGRSFATTSKTSTAARRAGSPSDDQPRQQPDDRHAWPMRRSAGRAYSCRKVGLGCRRGR